MSIKEKEMALRNMPVIYPTLEQLKFLDIGIYDEEGHLIGEKDGEAYHQALKDCAIENYQKTI